MPTLTNATVTRRANDVAFTWEVDGDLEDNDLNPWLLSVDLIGGENGPIHHFGFRYRDGKVEERFYFDFVATKNYYTPNVQPQRVESTWKAVFPAGTKWPGPASGRQHSRSTSRTTPQSPTSTARSERADGDLSAHCYSMCAMTHTPQLANGLTINTVDQPIKRVAVSGSTVADVFRGAADWLDGAARKLGEVLYVAGTHLELLDEDDDPPWQLSVFVHADEYEAATQPTLAAD